MYFISLNGYGIFQKHRQNSLKLPTQEQLHEKYLFRLIGIFQKNTPSLLNKVRLACHNQVFEARMTQGSNLCLAQLSEIPENKQFPKQQVIIFLSTSTGTCIYLYPQINFKSNFTATQYPGVDFFFEMELELDQRHFKVKIYFSEKQRV